MSSSRPHRRPSISRVLVGVLIALGAIALGIGLHVGISRIAADQEEREAKRADVERYVATAREVLGAYCASAALLEKEELFRRPKNLEGDDAGAYLNPRLPWEGFPAEIASMGLESPELGLEPDLKKVLEGDGWLSPSDLVLPDVGWMRGLRGFGRWSLLTGPLERKSFLDPIRRLEPSPRVLQLWAKLRFMHAFRDHRFIEASEDVRRLAHLAIATGDPVFAASAAALLKIEARAYEEASRSGLEVDGWRPIEPQSAARLSTLAVMTMMLADPALPSDLVEEARRCAKPSVLGCVLANAESAALVMTRTARPSELSPRFHSFEAALVEESAGCELALARAFWAYRPEGSAEQAEVEVARSFERSLDETGAKTGPLRRALWERYADYKLSLQREAMLAAGKDDQRRHLRELAARLNKPEGSAQMRGNR